MSEGARLQRLPTVALQVALGTRGRRPAGGIPRGTQAAAALAALGVMLIACISVNAWHHSPDSAARVASEFAENALVRGDYVSARALMFPEFVEVLPADGLAGLVARMHPDGLPNEVRATEYQPIPGFEGMNIFLEGRSGSSVFYYRILVHGTSTSGYEVAGFFRGSGPYPNAEARHPLD